MRRPPAAAELGARIRAERERAGVSVRGLAARLGVSPSLVSQLERGLAQPSVATLYSWARQLGVSIDRLFDEQDDAANPAEEHSPAPAPGDDPASEDYGLRVVDVHVIRQRQPQCPAGRLDYSSGYRITVSGGFE